MDRIIVKWPNLKEGDNHSDQWRSVSTFCRGPLPKMLSHTYGNYVFSPNPDLRIRFWNSIRGCIEEGEIENLQWLISYCRQKVFGSTETSYSLTAEDLLEYLSRDTLPFHW